MAGVNGEAAPSPGRQGGAVELRDVCKAWGTPPHDRVILDHCSLTVVPGKLNVLVGPSGCGKTLLIQLIAGYSEPTAGEVIINGQRVRGPGWDRLVVFQESALFPWMTVQENVAFGPLVRGLMRGRDARQAALRMLERFGLREWARCYPRQLSGGMQRRAELARAMINEPELMIMDEPFRGLDAMTRALMQEYYLRLFEESGRTNLFVTSEIDEAIFLADRLIVMSNSPSQVKRVITIDLPRPRDIHVMTTPRFADLKREALEVLHEEAVKSFAQGSKATLDLVGGLEHPSA
ncbi:MAG: ABC transporter ATP-binding protein [Chloroflexota bacterium]